MQLLIELLVAPGTSLIFRRTAVLALCVAALIILAFPPRLSAILFIVLGVLLCVIGVLTYDPVCFPGHE